MNPTTQPIITRPYPKYFYYVFYGFVILTFLVYLSENNILSLDWLPFLEYFTFYRCPNRKIGKITGEIFKENEITQNEIAQTSDIYVPCGYNKVESELRHVDFINKTKTNQNNNRTDNRTDKYVFGINGCDRLVSKNNLWKLLETCYTREQASRMMPETYILEDQEHLNLLKERFQPQKDILILKKNVQRKEGLKLTSDLKEVNTASSEKYKVAQKYMRDLYLINNRKVNLRVYYLIIITPTEKKFYLSTLGKCIYTKKEYNDNDFDFESNITSYHLDMNVYKTNPRDFDQLRNYLDSHTPKSKNKPYSHQNPSEYLFNDMTNKFKLLSQCVGTQVYQSPNLRGTTSFQLFGVDVIFDKNLNSYILEINKGPDMIPRDDIDHQMKKEVQKDMFALVGIIPEQPENHFQLLHSIPNS